jgi:DNA-binding response OmpR family regulator
MLMNLLSNAMKFTDNSGNIGLKVLHWEGWVAFTVWDTGIGIPPNKQHLIFQKFQQLESTMTRQFEGTGLGLVLTQRLARLHGGDITFTSQEHHGSQFTLLLPPEPPQTVTRDRHTSTAPQWEMPPPPVSLSSRLVLLIDANTNNLEELTEHLTTLGYRMAIARSGTDALAKARQLQPCAIFLNPNIPLLSGWDVLTLLKSGSETQHIPVIMMGASGVQAKARQSEIDGFLSFPVIHRRFKDLLEATTQTIDTISPHPTQHHVVLYLSDAELPLTDDDGHVGEATQPAIMQLSHLLHRHNFRVIESHDLEQAELLAKVWKAEVVVLNINQLDAMDYLMALVAHPYLASLPLVTLDSHTSHTANQIPNLAVFPCLVDWQQTGPNAVAEVLTETMLQAIEVAVGFAGRPLVLATDVNQWLSAVSLDRQDWLQALVQYMQAAGLRTSLGQSQREISQILQSQTVNLILLYWQGSGKQLQQVLESLQTLINTTANARFPSIILIDHHPRGRSISLTSRKLLDQMNITVVAPDASMDDLLHQIRQVLGVSPSSVDSS